jgi:thioester reductase-like protein
MSTPTVFLTGFPGFLGSRLLERILDRGDGPVACLVQPKYRDLAERRAAEIVAAAGTVAETAGEDWQRHVTLVEGDITEPDLGVDEPFSTVSEVYHLAAVYDLAVSESVAEAVNVRGTEHVLDFAERVDADRFQYVSTCYVSGRYDGVFTEDHLQEGQSFNNHYESSKYQAEVLVQRRMDEGLRATIYRPAITVGDSQTGETDKYDGPYYLLRLLLAQPSLLSVAPSLPGAKWTELNVVPRDFVVDAIAHLSDREDTVGEVYQLCDPAPLRVPAFVDAAAAALGHRTVSVPLPKPLVKRATRELQQRGVPAEPATIDYFDHPTRYANPATQRALAGSGIECPPLRSYLDTLVRFLRENPDVGEEAMV